MTTALPRPESDKAAHTMQGRFLAPVSRTVERGRRLAVPVRLADLRPF